MDCFYECNSMILWKSFCTQETSPTPWGKKKIEESNKETLSEPWIFMTIQSKKNSCKHTFLGGCCLQERGLPDYIILYTSAIVWITCHRQTSLNSHSICLKSKEFSASLSGSTWFNMAQPYQCSIATGYTGLGLHAVQEDVPNSHQWDGLKHDGIIQV